MSAETSPDLIRIAGVDKTYARGAEEIRVLSGLNLTVKRGEFLALMGPSGSGKSTLLNLIGGLDRPTRGTVEIGGESIGSLSDRKLAAWRAQHVGFVFQFYNLLPVMTAERNVELPLLLTHLSKSERRAHVATALGIVGLDHRTRHYPRQLSGGEQQRVGIARAVVTKPPILIADEPTGNLDPDLALEVMKLFRSFNDVGVTVVIASHDLHLIEQFGSRRIALAGGRIAGEAHG
jgi:putative ABC transport system ATP-binding protein